MVSTGNGPRLTGRPARDVGPVTGARPGPRRGVPSWAARPVPDARTAQALHGLEPHGWVPVADLRRPGSTPAGADHVVVGPGGVVVVQVARRADAMADGATHPAVADALAAAATVAVLLAPRHRTAVRALVCAPDLPRPGVGGGGVPVLGCEALVAHVRALPPRLGPADVTGLAQYLAVRLDGPHQALTTATLRTAPEATATEGTAAERAAAAGRGAAGRAASPQPGTAPAHRRAVRPLTAATPARPGAAGLALRAGVAGSVAWLAWVFTTAPLGLL